MVPFICKNSGMKFCKECKLARNVVSTAFVILLVLIAKELVNVLGVINVLSL